MYILVSCDKAPTSVRIEDSQHCFFDQNSMSKMRLFCMINQRLSWAISVHVKDWKEFAALLP